MTKTETGFPESETIKVTKYLTKCVHCKVVNQNDRFESKITCKHCGKEYFCYMKRA